MIPITLANPLDFEPNKNGYINVVDYNGNEVYKLGFAITGKIDGVKVSTTSHNFDWVATTEEYTYQKYINQFLIINDTPENFSYYETRNAKKFIATTDNAFNWTITIDNKYNDGNKITHKLENNYRDIENATFYYVFEVNNFNVMANGVRIQNEERLSEILGHTIRIEGYTLDFSDLMDNGFNIVDLYIGDGNIIGYPNNKIVALGVTKGNGDFNRGLSVTLDPTTSSYFGSAYAGVPWADWTNSAYAGVSDNNYATTTNDWKNLSISNFSALVSEGGSVPDDAIIQGFEWEVEAKGSADLSLGFPTLYAMVSGDKGKTVHDSWIFWYYEIGSEGFYPFGATSLTPYLNRWSANETSNENMQIMARAETPGSSIAYVDSGQVRITWTNPPKNNVTYRKLGDYSYYLGIPIEGDYNLTFGNTVLYYPFDLYYITNLYNYTNNFGGFDTWGATVGYNATFVDEGYIGSALKFKGDKGTYFTASSNYQVAGNYSNNHSYTIALWVRFDGGGNTQAVVSLDGSYNPAINTQYRLTRNPLGQFQIRNRNVAGTTNNCAGTIPIINGNWYHVVTTYNGTWRTIWTNGVLDALCNNLQGSLLGINTPLYLGDSKVTTLPALNGTIDEFLFLDYALDFEQVAGLYHNATKKVYPNGYYDIEDLNIGENTDLNLSILSKQYWGSNVTVQLGNLSGGSYTYGDPIDTYGNDTISSSILDGENFSIRLNLYAGTNDFISPIVYNYTAVGFNTTTPVVCSYSCSGQIIALPLDCLGQDLILDGLGTIDFTDSVKADSTQVTGGCFASFFDSLEVLN